MEERNLWTFLPVANLKAEFKKTQERDLGSSLFYLFHVICGSFLLCPNSC